MNRIIKFRAWGVGSNHGWFYGHFWKSKEQAFISNYTNRDFLFGDFAVNEKTVHQFTGLLDKNGREIYCGDIVKCYTKSLSEVVYNHEVKLPHFYQEIWSSFITEDGMWLPCDLDIEGGNICGGVEIIGNIYETPKLLDNK